MLTRDENLQAILKDLRAKGVLFRLVEGEFRARLNEALTEELATAIDICRPGLTRALRLQRNLCTDCGEKPITRPRHGERQWCEACYQARIEPTITRLRQSKNLRAVRPEPKRPTEETNLDFDSGDTDE